MLNETFLGIFKHHVDAAKKTWDRAEEIRWLSIRSLLLPWSIFFLSSHISKILSETCQHCHTNFAARQSEKERRKLISHSRQGKQSQAKKEKQTAVRWWQYTNQSSVQKIRPAAINGLSHRGKGHTSTTIHNGIGRFQLPVFATIFKISAESREGRVSRS